MTFDSFTLDLFSVHSWLHAWHFGQFFLRCKSLFLVFIKVLFFDAILLGEKCATCDISAFLLSYSIIYPNSIGTGIPPPIQKSAKICIIYLISFLNRIPLVKLNTFPIFLRFQLKLPIPLSRFVF